MTKLYVKQTKVTYGDQYGWNVKPIWSNDIDCRSSFSFGNKEQLARRFAKAFEAGVVYENAHVAIDVDNEQYVSYDMTILMRTANAELKRLGF